MTTIVNNALPLESIFTTILPIPYGLPRYARRHPLGRPTYFPTIITPVNIELKKKDDDDDKDKDKNKTIATALVDINTMFQPTIYSFPDLNDDNQVQKKFTLYFWYKLKNHWIKSYKKLFKYIRGSKGDYKLVRDMADVGKITPKGAFETDLIIHYILNEVYKKSDLARSLDKFRIQMNINWWELKYYKHTLKKFIYYQMKKKMQYKLY